MEFAVREHDADCLWALEKNRRAIAFYKKNGFGVTGNKQFEEGTAEYLIELKREKKLL